MNLSKLTFGQLYKLQHQTTLIRVTRAYHTALRREWYDWNERIWGPCPKWESVTKAEEVFPRFCAPWRKVIAFLRGPELRAAIKHSARMTQPRIVTGMWTDFRFIRVTKFDGPDFRLYEEMKAIARVCAVCISNFCAAHCIPAYFEWQEQEQRYVVRIETDELNGALLTWKPGTFWKTLVQQCEILGQDAHQVFWWAPHDIVPHQGINPGEPTSQQSRRRRSGCGNDGTMKLNIIEHVIEDYRRWIREGKAAGRDVSDLEGYLAYWEKLRTYEQGKAGKADKVA